jgi:hypothetical protein
MSKISDKEASMKDLFMAVDADGDNSGTISK